MKRTRTLGCLLVFLLSWSVLAAERSPDWVRQRIRTLAQSDTLGWRQIPWTRSLLEARRVSQHEKQPLFLLTLDGNLDTGRC